MSTNWRMGKRPRGRYDPFVKGKTSALQSHHKEATEVHKSITQASWPLADRIATKQSEISSNTDCGGDDGQSGKLGGKYAWDVE